MSVALISELKLIINGAHIPCMRVKTVFTCFISGKNLIPESL